MGIMDKWQGRVALVTGASAGIGADIAATLVKHGMKVIGCGRDIARIQELADSLKGEKGSLKAIKCDISKELEVINMFKSIKATHEGVDVCINNAGLNINSSLLDGQVVEWRQLMDVNVIGLTQCCQLAIKSMKERNVGDGYVINIGSILGFIVPPEGFFHFYTASKFAVRAISEGFRKELRAENSTIRVSHICPARTRTEIHQRMFGFTTEQADNFFSNTGYLNADDITSAVVTALSHPSHVEMMDCILQSVNMPAYGTALKIDQ